MAHDDELDWFGHPLPPSQGGPRLAVPCPLCSELFQQGPALAGHLEAAHDYTIRRRTSPLDRLPSWLRGLGFLPLWFVLPMTVVLVRGSEIVPARVGKYRLAGFERELGNHVTFAAFQAVTPAGRDPLRVFAVPWDADQPVIELTASD